MKKQAKAKSAAVPTTAKLPSAKRNYTGFRGTRQLLLKTAEIGWKNYLSHQPAFASLSSKFTVKMAEDELSAIREIEEMELTGNLDNLRLDHVEDEFNLVQVFRTALWYFEEAFPDKEMKQKMEGMPELQRYSVSKRKQKGKYAELIHDFNLFFTKYQKPLEKNGNMPTSFIEAFNKVARQYHETLEQLALAEAAQDNLNHIYAERCKARYDALKKMLKAGTSVLFPSEPSLRKLFTLEQLKAQVVNPNETTLSGSVNAADTKLYIKKASVSIDGNPPLESICKYGFYKFELEKGIYQVTATAPGYQPSTLTKTVKEGISNNLKFYLEPIG
jgi:hypothetical protein